MTDSNSTLEMRIVKLERTIRLLKVFVIGLPCLALFLGAQAASTDVKAKKVMAEQFLLTDSEGNVRAMLGNREGGGADLTLIDSAGKTRVLLTASGANKEGAHKNAPALYLMSSNEKPALVAGINPDYGIGSIDFLLDGQFKGGNGGNALKDK